MQVGTHIDGRDLTYDQSSAAFAIGGAPVTPQQLHQYDDRGQIRWVDEETGDWFRRWYADSAEFVVAVPKSPRLLGFRSRNPWKRLVASAYYVSWLVFTVAAVAARTPYVADVRDGLLESVKGLMLGLFLISPALLLSDFAFRARLPLFRQRRILMSASGFAVLFVAVLASIGLVDALHSPSYKAAAQEARLAERLETEQRQEAERSAREKESALLSEQNDEEAAGSGVMSSESQEQQEDALDLGEMDDTVLIENFLAACGEIGIDPAQIKKLQRLSDWAGGERYSMVYESNGLDVYANADKSINSINLGDLHVFEQGLEPLQIQDYLVDWTTIGELQIHAQRVVKDALSFPDTADFPWLETPSVARRQSIYVVGGTVTAKNAFGVTKTMSYYVEFEKSGEAYLTRYFVLDGETVAGKASVIPEIERKEVAAEAEDGTIVLIDGVCGEYGVAKEIDGDTYIWYHVPPGRYTVTSQTNFTKLYLDKNQTVKSPEGWSECVAVATLDFTNAGDAKELVVSKDQHIELTVSSKVTLTPAR